MFLNVIQRCNMQKRNGTMFTSPSIEWRNQLISCVHTWGLDLKGTHSCEALRIHKLEKSTFAELKAHGAFKNKPK